MERMTTEEVARKIVECQHGKYFCAGEFLAEFLEDNCRLFTFYRKQHPVMSKTNEIYDTGSMKDEAWIHNIRPFLTLFCMTFEAYNEITLLVTLGAEREKALKKLQIPTKDTFV